MKRPASLFILSLFSQSQRLPLIEVFTNASCGPCAPFNDDLYLLLDTNPGKYALISYHVDWPSYDPMNEHNPADPQTRRFFYSVSGVPRPYMDGTVVYPTQADIDSFYAIPAPFDLALTHSLSTHGDSVHVTATYTANQAISGNLRAYIVINEKLKVFDEPPGYNGEDHFRGIMKKMLPDAQGTVMPTSFSPGQSFTVTESWEIENFYDLGELEVVAWVQDYTSKTVHQSAVSDPIPLPFALTLDPANGKDLNVTGAWSTSTFTSNFTTDLSTADDYTFELDKTDLPPGWTASLTVDGTTDANRITTNIAGMGNKDITVNITSADGLDESAKVRLIAHNANTFTAYTKNWDFTVHSNVTNLVIDLGYVYDSWWYGWLLEDRGHPEVTINGSQFDNIDLVEFDAANIGHIFTTSGYYSGPAIYTDDQLNKLTQFLDGGGDLFIAGDDIGVSQNLAGASQTFKDFFSNYLGATYVSNGIFSDSIISGIATDPVFGPLNWQDTIRSWYTPYFDRVQPNGPYATAAFTYNGNPNEIAGIRNEDPTVGWKVVYCAWVLHLTGNTDQKVNLIDKSVEWFDAFAVGEKEPELPDGPRLGQNYPNPFLNSTRIPLAGIDRPMLLVLRDLQGKVVREIPVPMGSKHIDLQLDGLHQGLYLYSLNKGEEILETRKMVICK